MKAKFLALAALVLGMVSCQTNFVDGVEVDANGEAAVTLQVGLPEDVTRAVSYGDSGIGAIGNLDLASEWDIRYILEVYDSNGNLAKERKINREDASTKTTFSLRLIPGRMYRFVVWADFIPQTQAQDDYSDYHYNTNDIRRILLNNAQLLNDESRDAYTGYVDVDNFRSSSSIALTLKRPFAKLRVVTTDMSHLYTQLVSSKVVYTSKIYTQFNAYSSKKIEGSEVSGLEKTVVYSEYDYTETGDKTLFADYFFGSENGTVMFTLDVTDNTSYDIPTVNFNTNIPVDRNHLTTIKGNILTDANEITVTIEEKFAGYENWPDTDAEQLAYAAMFGGEVTLTENVTLTQPLCVAANKHLIINLNGKKIENTTKSLEYGEGEAIIAYGKLTINGSGNVIGSTRAVWARGNDGAEVNIYGGIYQGCMQGYTGGGNSVIYASSGNVVNIYGGTVQALYVDKTSYADKTNGVYAALNVADNNGTINVYGGKFYRQNPAAPGTEPADWNAEHPNGFVAEGYDAYPVSGHYYEVYSLDEARKRTFTTIGSRDYDFELLRTVFRNGGKVAVRDNYTGADVWVAEALIADGVDVEISGGGEIYLKEGVTTIYEQGVASALICAKNGATITFKDYSGYVDGGSEDYAIETRGGNIVINGNEGHFHGAVSAAYALEGTITINGGTFVANGSSYGAQYLLNCHDANYNDGKKANIVVKGGSFVGFDPANNAAEGPNTNFVAEGYKSTESNGTWKVSKK